MSKQVKSNMKKSIRKNIKHGNIFNDLLNQNIYNKEIITFKIKFKFNEINKYLENKFIDYAKKNIMGKCHKEGYISNNYVNIIEYSSAMLESCYCYFDVQYEFMVCYPYEGMIINCKIQNITKIGVKAVLSDNENENPVVIFASRIHNESILSNTDIDEFEEEAEVPSNDIIKINGIIKIKVIGYRFEINDPYLSVLAEIVKDEPKIIMN